MEALNGMVDLSYEEIVKEFSPRISKCLRNTPIQEREDLEQEIKIKIYEKMDLIQNIKAPDFFEFVENN